LSSTWESTAPIAKSLVSVSRMWGEYRGGCESGLQCVERRFLFGRPLNGVSLGVRRVNGLTMAEELWINRL
jgi:hypothetical protein